MKTFLCFTIVVAFVATSITASSFANNECTPDNPDHTLRKYPCNCASSACGTVLSAGFTNAEKDEIVRKHNSLRQYVAAGNETRGSPGPQPPALNMKNMTWDDALANTAQRWANQCHFGHDSCRSTSQFYVGQNVAYMATTGTLQANLSDVIQMWYNEVTKVNRNQISNFIFIEDVGHYTQMVWADSDRVGCGKIVNKKDMWAIYYMVCNYGPGGNIIGAPIYDAY